MKKVLSLLLAVMMLTVIFVMPANAATTNVAMIVGGSSYATLGSAVADVSGGGVIKLLANAASITDTTGKNFTVALNGYTLSGTMNVTGTLTVEGSGTYAGSSSGGTIDCTNVKNGYVACRYDSSNTLAGLYKTLQDAIDAAASTDIIEIWKDGLTATVTKACTFKIDHQYYVEEIITVSGMNCVETKNGTQTTYKLTASSASSSSSEDEGDYPIRVTSAPNGTVKVKDEDGDYIYDGDDRLLADYKEDIMIYITPSSGYMLDTIKVHRLSNEDDEVTVYEKATNRYTFRMPKYSVRVTVTFKKTTASSSSAASSSASSSKAASVIYVPASSSSSSSMNQEEMMNEITEKLQEQYDEKIEGLESQIDEMQETIDDQEDQIREFKIRAEKEDEPALARFSEWLTTEVEVPAWVYLAMGLGIVILVLLLLLKKKKSKW